MTGPMRRVCEIAVFTGDLDATTEFYSRVFGVEPHQRSEGSSTFQIGEVTVLVHESYKAAEGDLPAEDHFAVGVADVSTALAESRLDSTHGPTDHSWGRSAYVKDPDGRLVELKEL